MTINYTSLLGLAQPVTGTESGVWGTVVNDSITQLVEDSVAGVATNSVAGGNWTLTTTGSGAANQARCAILIPTGSPGVSRNIIAPSQSKAYVVINQSNAAVVLKGSATTGVTIATGTQALCAWNGSDFVQIGNTGTGDVVGPASATDNAVARFDGTTGKLIQNSAVTIADTTGDITGGKYNGLTVSTTTGTFTLTNAKTLAVQNTLTLAGTDSTTMTFPSSSATVAGLGINQTFTGTQTFSGTTSALAMVVSDTAETTTVSAIAATGTINYDVTTQSVLYYTTNASGNWTVNFRASSGTSLDTVMSTGQTVTVAFLVTQGATPYYNSAVQIDGGAVTPKWQGGTAPTAGNASSIDAYVYSIVKTGAATFTVFASQTKFA